MLVLPMKQAGHLQTCADAARCERFGFVETGKRTSRQSLACNASTMRSPLIGLCQSRSCRPIESMKFIQFRNSSNRGSVDKTCLLSDLINAVQLPTGALPVGKHW
ncbi:MAG: hypothetical protein CMB79_06475 [Filomicrobium sp.]|nr:hypothetical protein [Filomicrobium sp.]MAI45518.1 hypothetical protein [Filomicrobium sp.]